MLIMGPSKLKKSERKTETQNETTKSSDAVAKSGVIFMRGVPDGFFEHEQRDYFSQFGKVTNVRILRSIKTGRNRGCAWVKFADAAVAQIADDSMNNYLMENKLLKCVHLRENAVPPKVFAISGPMPAYWRSRRHAKQMNSAKTDEKIVKLQKRLLAGLHKRNRQLAAFGIDYKFELPEMKAKTEMDPDVVVTNEISSSDPCKTEIKSEVEPDSDQDQSMIVDSQKYALLLDSSDDEIVFQTPPMCVKKSKSERTNDSGPSLRLAVKNKKKRK